MHRPTRRLPIVALCLAFIAGSAAAQYSITQPPSGGNQHAIVTQYIGPVSVTIDYRSPDVTGPNGEDRRGKIWGDLVPWGLTNLGFGTCAECPWRAGANENTTFTVSHDVEINGKPLPAGTYALFMIANPEEWTVIFSRNSTSWGSFFYDPAEDALRVPVKPQKSEHHEWLTYEFTDRDPDHATVAMKWEELAVSFDIQVPAIEKVYMAEIGNELRSYQGFIWQNWNTAAAYALANGYPKEALAWAQKGASAGFGTEENFTTLMTLSQAQEMNGMVAESKATRAKALQHPTASALGLHQLGRQLIAQGKAAEALEVFELNHKRFGDAWPINVGLTRGYSAVGDYKKALKYAKAALAQAPDELNRRSLENMIKLLSEGKNVN